MKAFPFILDTPPWFVWTKHSKQARNTYHNHSEQVTTPTWWKWRKATTSTTTTTHTQARSSSYMSRCCYITTRAEPASQHN